VIEEGIVWLFISAWKEFYKSILKIILFVTLFAAFLLLQKEGHYMLAEIFLFLGRKLRDW
jgi:hypothetical protein